MCMLLMELASRHLYFGMWAQVCNDFIFRKDGESNYPLKLLLNFKLRGGAKISLRSIFGVNINGSQFDISHNKADYNVTLCLHGSQFH